MSRDINLILCLPLFMQEYREFIETFSAENPEFCELWEDTEAVLNNQFIELADEYGISRFEKLLNIKPSQLDDLETRRNRVKINWFKNANYTYKYLITQLENICGEENFAVDLDYNNYTIKITVPAEYFVDVRGLLKEIVPCNLVQVFTTKTDNNTCLYVGGAVTESTTTIIYCDITN